MNEAYSVKLPQEVQNTIKKLVEQSGLTNKDFITTLVKSYELEQMKLNTPIVASDVSALQQLTNRINNIFIGIGERFDMLDDNYKRELSENAVASRNTIKLLQQRINELEIERLENEKTKIRTKELEEEIEHLKSILNDKSALIAEYKEKNDILTTIEGQYKSVNDKNEKQQKIISDLMQQSCEREKTLESLQNKIKELEENCNRNIELIKKEYDLNKETCLLELKKEHNKEIDLIRLEYGNKIKEFLKLDTQAEQRDVYII